LTTGVIDASIDLNQAAIHLTALKRFCKRNAIKIAVLLKSKSAVKNTVRLSKRRYHQKLLDNIFLRYGDEHIQKSFHYMWNVFEALKTVPEVLKPAKITPLIGSNHQALIFTNLQKFLDGLFLWRTKTLMNT
jgi:phosphoribulokinase